MSKNKLSLVGSDKHRVLKCMSGSLKDMCIFIKNSVGASNEFKKMYKKDVNFINQCLMDVYGEILDLSKLNIKFYPYDDHFDNVNFDIVDVPDNLNFIYSDICLNDNHNIDNLKKSLYDNGIIDNMDLKLFKKSQWTVITNWKILKKHSGVIYRVKLDGNFMDKVDNLISDNETIVKLNNSVYIYDNFDEYGATTTNDINLMDIKTLSNLMKMVIKYRHPDKSLIKSILGSLWNKKSYFDKDVSRCITANESIIKTYLECAYTYAKPSNPKYITYYSICLYLSMNIIIYKPNYELLEEHFMDLYNSLSIGDIKFDDGDAKITTTFLSKCDFNDDIKVKTCKNGKNIFIDFPLYRCFDYNSSPYYIYYIDPEYISKYLDKKDIYKNLSQLYISDDENNPRLGIDEIEDIDDEICEGQKIYMNYITSNMSKKTKNIKEESIEIPDSWYSALIGSYKIDSYVITVSSIDRNQFVVSSKDISEKIDEDKKNDIQCELYQKINDGIKSRFSLNGDNLVNITYNKLKNVILFDGKEWNDFKNYKFSFSETDLTVDIVNDYKISKYSNTKSTTELQNLLNLFDIKYIIRAYSILSLSNNVITFIYPRSNSNKKHIYDVWAYRIINLISYLYPFCISQISIDKYKINNTLYYFYLKRIIRKYISKFSNIEKVSFGDVWDRSNRSLYNYQKETINILKSRFKKGEKGSFVWLKVGSGKTLIALTAINAISKKFNRILYTLPNSSIKSIVKEINAMGYNCIHLCPIKSSRNIEGVNEIKSVKDWKKGFICLIEHDHIRMVYDDLIKVMSNTLFVIDEVHKTISYNTHRGDNIQNLAVISKYFISMTGTPLIDSSTFKLAPWLMMTNNYPIVRSNHLTAVNTMISNTENVSIKEVVEKINIDEQFIKSDIYSDYQSKLLIKYGGNVKSGHQGKKELLEAIEYCYRMCDEYIVDKAIECEKNGRGAFIVTSNIEHQKYINVLLQKRLIECGMKSHLDKIFMVSKTETLYHTDETVKNGERDWRFVISPISKSEGYTCTRISCQLSSVYFSNDAQRTQIKGRINRIGQASDNVLYYYYTCGVLERFYESYQNATNAKKMLSNMLN